MSTTYQQLEPVIMALDDRIKTNLGAFPTDTAEGSIASFMDGADDIPLKSLVVDINPVQDLSQGDPSPENICPISGWTGANVVRCGKNLLPNLKFQNAPSTVGIGQTEYVSANQKIYLSAGTYTLSTVTTASGCCYYKKKGGTNTTIGSSSQVNPNGTFTITETGFYAFWIYNTNGFSTDDLISFQLEKSATATPYEPYNGTTIPIDWQTEAGTVYGGKLDVLSGVLTVYPYYASYNGETLTGRWISDRDVYAVGTTPTIGAQVVNIGAEGTEIQLSPHEVKSLLGQNNIFADTGDSAVEYRADTKLYIERLTEPDADMIADANIVSGSYFMVGNKLYKATANIASGGQVIVGTNAIRKSLSEALNEINS